MIEEQTISRVKDEPVDEFEAEFGPEDETEEPDEDEIFKVLDRICKDSDEEDRETRNRQLARWRRLDYFWKGYQYLIENGYNFESPELNPEMFGDDYDDLYYTKVINIFKAHGEAIIAAMSVMVPQVTFTPDDAENPSDVDTAKAYRDISKLIQKHNDAKLLGVQAVYIQFTQGLICGRVRYDKSFKYGKVKEPKIENVASYACQQCDADMTKTENGFVCPNCGDINEPSTSIIEQVVGWTESPKGRTLIDLYGPINVSVPHWCKKQDDIPILRLVEDWHITRAKQEFSEFEDKIDAWQDPEVEEQTAREAVESVDNTRLKLCTVNQYWIRPQNYTLISDPKIRARVQEEYPDGVKLTRVNDIVVRLEAENLDDAWTLSNDPRSKTIHADPTGAALVPIQEVLNELFNLTLQTIEQAIPENYADPEVLDFEAYRKTERKPGQTFPAKPKPGRTLSESFYSSRTATVSQEIEKFSAKVEQLGQLSVGAFPSIYGGQLSGSRTASEYDMSRKSALQRLSTAWLIFTQFWIKLVSRSVVMFATNMQEDEKYSVQAANSYINVWIRKAHLDGRIGSVEPESSEQLPTTMDQKKETIMQLMQMGSPEINQVLMHPENRKLLKSIVGIEEFYIPGANDQDKQLEEIDMLLRSQPVDEQPTVPADQIDDHLMHIQVCKAFLISERGRIIRLTNPNGYKNVELHLQMHEQLASGQKQSDQPMSGPGETPETAATTSGA